MSHRIPFHPFVVFFLFVFSAARSQDTVRLSLEEAVAMAREHSVDALIAANQRNNAFWSFRSWQADRRPLLSLNGTLPRFERTIIPITLPDGSEAFVSRSLATSNLELAISQEIGLTGGDVFLGSGLQRIDLFGDSTTTSYLSSPFFIGINQPLLRFNPWKWRRMIEPLRMDEADRAFLEDMEAVAMQTVAHFFALHLALINRQIASTNLANNDTIYRISQGRYNLGRIAENDLLQTELSLLNSQVAYVRAENEIANGRARLVRFLDLPEATIVELVAPTGIPEVRVTPGRALEHALEFRSDPLSFRRRILEAERDVAQARGESGFSADLFAQYGLNATGSALGDAYSSPEDFQTVGLGLNVPILDWGKARAQREIAHANRDLVESQVERSRINFEQEVTLLVQQFNLQPNQVAIAAKADTVSLRRFEVAKARYLIGKTGITDLNIASEERDQARRAYIAALNAYWRDYYALRMLTLYDYVEDRPIEP